MTISAATPLRVTVAGNDTATLHSFSPLRVTAADDLVVVLEDSAGAETILTRGTGTSNYSVNTPTGGYPGTSSIVYPADTTNGTPLATGAKLHMHQGIPLTQSTDLDNQGGYFPETQEQTFDRIVGMIKGVQEELDRCIRLRIGDAPSSPWELANITATNYLRINAAGDGIEPAAIATTTGSASDVAPADVSVSAAAAGSNAAYSRDDHVHLLPTTVPRLATENTFAETQIWTKGSDVASAAALALGAGNWFDITGTTTVTSITTIGVGTLVILHFDGALTLTHHSTNLVLPDSQNIVTEAGDEAMLWEYATGDWRLVSYSHQVPLYKQKAADPTRKVTFYDDFLGDLLLDEYIATATGGTGNAVALSIGQGGRVEIKTSSADGAISANGSSICLGALNWRADQGGLVMETRLQVDDITSVMFFVGFTDVLGSTVEAPIFLVTTAIASDATDACGVGFDTDGTTAQFFHGGVKADTDTAPAYSGTAPVNATYVTIRVEVSSAGAVRGFINGTAIGAAVAAAVTTTAPLCPIIFCANRSASVRNILVDYVWVQANR